MKRSAQDARSHVGLAPRVDLLPPEVRADRTWRHARRSLYSGVAIVAVLCAAALGQTALTSLGANATLSDAHARTQQLLSGEHRYAEVLRVQSAIAAAEQAESTATATWIDWHAYLQKVQAGLPSGAHLTSFAASTSVATPAGATTGAATSAAATPVATVTLGASTTNLDSIETWMGALAQLPGYLDASPGSVTGDATGGLQVQVTMHLGPGAYSKRDSSTPAATPTPTATPDPTPSVTPTPSPSATPTSSPTDSPSPTPTTSSAAGAQG